MKAIETIWCIGMMIALGFGVYAYAAPRKLHPIERWALDVHTYIDTNKLGHFDMANYRSNPTKFLLHHKDQMRGYFKDLQHAIDEGTIDPAALEMITEATATLYTLRRVIKEEQR